MSALLAILAAYRTNEAYDNLVNGKPAVEWVMERQSVTTDKPAASPTTPSSVRPDWGACGLRVRKGIADPSGTERGLTELS